MTAKQELETAIKHLDNLHWIQADIQKMNDWIQRLKDSPMIRSDNMRRRFNNVMVCSNTLWRKHLNDLISACEGEVVIMKKELEAQQKAEAQKDAEPELPPILQLIGKRLVRIDASALGGSVPIVSVTCMTFKDPMSGVDWALLDDGYKPIIDGKITLNPQKTAA